jgi:translation elongation factor EF-G
MPHVLSSDNNEHDDLGPIAVTVTVPEEFLGFSVGALAARQGYLSGIYNQHGQAVIEASLPASQFEALQKAIIEYAGTDRCSVKLADRLAETDN